MAVAVVGVGEVPATLRDGRTASALAVDACRRALTDAGLEPRDVDGFVTEGHSMPRRAPIDVVGTALGAGERAFAAHTSLAGAGVVGALQLARQAIDSRLASVVVSYYGISLSARSGGVYSHHAEEPLKAAFEMPFGFYGQPVYFAALAQRYAHEHGLLPVQLGAVAMAARAFAQRTPGALKTETLSLDDYLADKLVASPLRRLDCCLVNDGAAAFVVTSIERARLLRRPPVVVAGAGFSAKPFTEADFFSQNEPFLVTGAAQSGARAFADARLQPPDVDIAQVYDCFTISTILQLEDLGFFARGEAAAAAADGAIGPGGSLPVNTHGGLLSNSFIVGAGHIVEAVRQLRGERGDGQIAGAEVALVAGLGAQDHATVILSKDR